MAAELYVAGLLFGSIGAVGAYSAFRNDYPMAGFGVVFVAALFGTLAVKTIAPTEQNGTPLEGCLAQVSTIRTDHEQKKELIKACDDATEPATGRDQANKS